MRRQSITIPGFSHGDNPIPAASRVGSFLISGAIYGLDLASGRIPPDVESQCANIFNLMRFILAAGDATMEDVIKVTAYLRPGASRTALNAEWLRAFPNPKSRPARHTIVNPNLPDGQLMQCDLMAVVRGAREDHGSCDPR
ncbi:2-iminobutanoate/2-iminopropanoate deaminase [Bradyrhizobium sp. GM24.11]